MKIVLDLLTAMALVFGSAVTSAQVADAQKTLPAKIYGDDSAIRLERHIEQPGANDEGNSRATTKDPSTSARPDAPSGSEPATTGMASAARAFTATQRSIIHDAILKEHVMPLRNVDFNLSLGAVVPRTVVLHPLPPGVVDIEPIWDGYLFFLAGSGVIVVNPDSLQIVAAIEF